MPEPTDPITELAATAAQLHEPHLSYVQAGFTERQAFDLTKAVLAVSVGGQA
ncbi:hypothetical protein [Streptomyces sp. NPDC058653]|uniref:hypothetical protein n=1 Tax=Streptomyces sp. NPDC058653 TaxID=3346576 RepID=UPI0036694C24